MNSRIRLSRILTRESAALLLLALLWNMTVYRGSRLLTAGVPHYDMSTALDALIPLIPWTGSIYLGCYLFWAVNYALACTLPRQKRYQFFSGELLAKALCFVCFLLLPTAVVRPEPSGEGFWPNLIGLIYRMDAPDNLFPSIHCLVSWYAFIAVREQPRVPSWYWWFSLAFALAVCISTLTTKQHLIPDVIAGLLLAEGSFRLSPHLGFPEVYARLLSRLRKGNGDSQ